MNLEEAEAKLSGQHYFVRVEDVSEEPQEVGDSIIWVTVSFTEGPLKDFFMSLPFSEIIKDKPSIGGITIPGPSTEQ